MMKFGDMVLSMIRLVLGLTMLGTIVYFGYCFFDRGYDVAQAANDVAAMWVGAWVEFRGIFGEIAAGD